MPRSTGRSARVRTGPSRPSRLKGKEVAMGLLDDAIREHLELKRKHGADPEDVARQEQEALGPGQRNEFAQPAAEEAAPAEPEPVPAPEDEEAPAAIAASELPGGHPGTPEGRPPEHPPGGPGYDGARWLEEEPDEVPAEEALEPHQRPA